jgi:photosystem II stability/assembly factor-like uncharacterized protein
MTQEHRLYVGTIGEGLYRRIGDGDFTRVCDGMFVECHVRALAVHPKEPRLLYLGSEQGLFRSRDGADNWERVESPLNDKQIWSILLLPDDPNVILVGTCPPQLYRSEDGGKTWHQPKIEIAQECPRIIYSRVTTLLADPTDPATVWAGVEIDGIFRSRDAGLTWMPIGAGLSSRDIHSLAIVPHNGTTRMLAATNNDLNLSNDGGLHWQGLHIKEAMPWPYCRALAQVANDPGRVLLGNGDGPPGSRGVIGISSDAGATWQQAAMPHRANSTIWNFAVNPADSTLIYASSVSGEVYRSTDAGASWTQIEREFGEIRALAWSE